MARDSSTTLSSSPRRLKVRGSRSGILDLQLNCGVGLGPSLTPKLLLQFINQQGNILLALAGDSPTPSAISSLLAELDIHLSPDRNSLVLDHFHHDVLSSSDQHDVLVLPRPQPSRPDVRSFFGGDGVLAFPRAVAQELGSRSALLAPILKAQNTAYSYNPKEEKEIVEDPFEVGQQISIVSAMQARNSARFTVYGSVEALENKWFDAQVQTTEVSSMHTANRDFARQVSAWTFQEIGILKSGKVEHHESSTVPKMKSNDDVVQVGFLNPSIYRIKNDVTFNIELSEYDRDHLKPFQVQSPDALQIEFSMLSPFQRLNLEPVSRTLNSTVFSSTFRLPDQHGIFRFEVNYKRPFLTYIDVKREVTVRHFAHDEWPRSWQISGGWVWITGIWATILGWVAFVAIWLWSGPAYGEKLVKKMQ
ncbi:uncharacterized protein KY384_000643 [Bacidia gigantensis]|uniref:uncharacterized protein n=1 Tax=Bacidia gigantensis TaxID=2732470 RepID=UPI001D0552BA|nr:uncharacterized protein KY384_000643 [Bacidia gigantensis]KAG8525883.1 hypothetical protein KY384_000643 [Bacidia gigantensis]